MHVVRVAPSLYKMNIRDHSLLSPPIMLASAYIASLMHIDPHSEPKVLDHLYCRQPNAVEIIQLIEVPAPSQRFPSSLIEWSSSSSSYYSSESESEYDDPQSVGTSYCSSDTPEELDLEEEISKPDETYDTRATRVHAWREKFAKDMGLTISNELPVNATKRKAPDEYEIDQDTASSHSSKRSRSHNSSSLATHICAACDASFSTRQHLRRHGQAAHANEACRIAVDYDFE